MATNVYYQAVIFLFCYVMLSAGLQVEVKSLKYCGPPDKTLKYKVSPWPVITDADSVNVTLTFTPARDILSLSFFANVTKHGKTIIERNKELNCNYVPYDCYFSADGEIWSHTHTVQSGAVLRFLRPGGSGRVMSQSLLTQWTKTSTSY